MTQTKTFDLEWLLSPVSVEDFSTKIWQRHVCLVASERPHHFENLFGFRDLEFVLEYGQPKPPSIRLVSSRANETVEVPFGRGGRLDMDRIRRFYAEGYTVVVNNVQDYSPSVAKLVQSMQERMSYPIEANTYLTPPASQGFKPHYDTHDVLVAQVEGEKLWRVYGAEAACPLPELTDGDPFRRENLPTPEFIRLVPGDLLYIPRGWIHEAESDNGSSLHLTFGIHAPTGRDLLQTAIDVLCRVHPEFRQSLPFAYLRCPANIGELTEVLKQLITRLQTDGSAEAALSLLEDDFIRRGRSVGEGEFVASVDALQHLAPETRLERKRHLHARIIPTRSGSGLQFSQSLLEGPVEYREAMQFILDKDIPFLIKELPGLNTDQKLALSASLLRDGLVRLAQDNAQGWPMYNNDVKSSVIL